MIRPSEGSGRRAGRALIALPVVAVVNAVATPAISSVPSPPAPSRPAPGSSAPGSPAPGSPAPPSSTPATRLPVDRMEHILQADGHVTGGGILEVDIDRSDLHVTGGEPATRFEDGFQLQHELHFASLGGGRTIINGDLALRPGEIQPVIDALLAHHITFQAEHQHLYDLSPMMWFIHFRATGDPLDLARSLHDVITTATSTPLPQHAPSRPTTPLPADRLARVPGGDATVGENGIVTITVRRAHRIGLGGHPVDPDLGVSTQIQFQPASGGRAVAVPDFSMTASEVQPVVRVMRGRHWLVGCLYNQETAEHPQLYFAHMFKVGDPVTLARQIRTGLDRTDAVRAH